MIRPFCVSVLLLLFTIMNGVVPPALSQTLTGKPNVAILISSGIDGALHVISKIHGKGWAQAVALNMEYNWQPDSDYARAALADKYLWGSARELLSMRANPLNAAGDKDHWQNKWLVQTNLSAEEVLVRINDVFETKDQWTKRHDGNANPGMVSFWTFTDEKYKHWKGVARVEHVPKKKDELIVTTEIERVQ